ncbi:hypothetical protein BDQ17DRAFT_368692 [Cyathus striatus]|nr:hypothetical protein BDQ17DRAFT_368692 [Cyathus striatus]
MSTAFYRACTPPSQAQPPYIPSPHFHLPRRYLLPLPPSLDWNHTHTLYAQTMSSPRQRSPPIRLANFAFGPSAGEGTTHLKTHTPYALPCHPLPHATPMKSPSPWTAQASLSYSPMHILRLTPLTMMNILPNHSPYALADHPPLHGAHLIAHGMSLPRPGPLTFSCGAIRTCFCLPFPTLSHSKLVPVLSCDL